MFNWQIEQVWKLRRLFCPKLGFLTNSWPWLQSLFWTLEGNAYFASGPLNVTMMLCRSSAVMRFVWLQTRWTENSLELSFFFPFQLGMLTSSVILTSFLKHRVILSSLTPLDDQGNNISLSALLYLDYWFLSFFLWDREKSMEKYCWPTCLRYVLSVKSSIRQDLLSLDFYYYPSLYLIILWERGGKASLRLCKNRSRWAVRGTGSPCAAVLLTEQDEAAVQGVTGKKWSRANGLRT